MPPFFLKYAVFTQITVQYIFSIVLYFVVVAIFPRKIRWTIIIKSKSLGCFAMNSLRKKRFLIAFFYIFKNFSHHHRSFFIHFALLVYLCCLFFTTPHSSPKSDRVIETPARKTFFSSPLAECRTFRSVVRY